MEGRGETGKVGRGGKGKGEGACERVAKGRWDSGFSHSIAISTFSLMQSLEPYFSPGNPFHHSSFAFVKIFFDKDQARGGAFWVLEGGEWFAIQRERRIHGFFNSET